ncbi:MAG: CoA-binding protein, partial [Alphaproteobacteria bacterium]
MTVRNLDAVFRPRSIAVIGAGTRDRSVGAVLARNLAAAGFPGPIHAVHPREAMVQGLTACPSVAALPVVPDLAVIATPPDTVPGLIAELGAKGTRAVIVITAGFGETSDEGHGLRQAALDAARPHLLRIVGPNCLGVLVPGSGLDASFAHIRPQPGGVAFVAQSGAMVTSILDWAVPRGIGFSHLVSLGDMLDVDFGDMLDWLATDPKTTAILLYIEAITHSRKFMSAARAAARVKPVIAIKAGRFAEGARAASSHTGALAGIDAVYDAAFARAGILRVRDIEELFDAVETLARAGDVPGARLGIMTNGGGMGVLATDALIGAGGSLPDLAPETVTRLDAVLPPTWSRANPVDIIGDATGERYGAALDALLDDPGLDALLVLNCPTAVASSEEAAQAVVDTLAARGGRGRKPLVLTSWVGEFAAAAGRRLDDAMPYADGQLPGGVRLHAVLSPVATDGA